MEGKSDITKLLEEIEIKAVKRFAKRLKEKSTYCVSTKNLRGGAVWVDDIDNLVKEMEGELK